MRYLLLLLSVVSLSASAADNLRILLTNDDGFTSPGIQALHTALRHAGHDVYVIAPTTQQSGAGASVSTSGIKVTAYPDQVWAVEGRPADAVRVGLGNIMYSAPPDLVISGANHGQNTGQDVNISGTVGAAITAFRLGVPAIALSVGIRLDEVAAGFPSTMGAYSGAARLLVRLIRNMKLEDLTAVLNINYPALLPLDVRGVRWSELSDHSLLGKRYNLSSDGRYRPELVAPTATGRSRDAETLEQGFVTLTFLDGDMSITPKRSQRYLDRQLLDSSYEPANMPASVPNPRPIKQAVPVPYTTRLGERIPTDPALNMEVPPRQERAADTEETPREPAPQSAPEGKAKPDSWLRRIFDPSSWRQ